MSASDDFTEDEYRRLVRLACQRYRLVHYGDYRDAPAGSALWRHDLDFSVHRGRALARIEADEGARATYFVSLHSPFYNALEAEVADLVREILALGHDLALHFDPSFYVSRSMVLEEALTLERELLESLFESRVEAFSIHNPAFVQWSDDRDEIAGLVNAYGTTLRGSWGYCSDSHGSWRSRRLRDVLEAGADERLHVLTHPEWWVPEPLEPLARVARSIDGRAARQHERYDRVLADMLRSESGR
jgi:hypothetical protein